MSFNVARIEQEALALVWSLNHYGIQVGSGVVTRGGLNKPQSSDFPSLSAASEPETNEFVFLLGQSLFLQSHLIDIYHIKEHQQHGGKNSLVNLCFPLSIRFLGTELLNGH